LFLLYLSIQSLFTSIWPCEARNCIYSTNLESTKIIWKFLQFVLIANNILKCWKSKWVRLELRMIYSMCSDFLVIIYDFHTFCNMQKFIDILDTIPLRIDIFRWNVKRPHAKDHSPLGMQKI
jgi:hypothetical protein